MDLAGREKPCGHGRGIQNVPDLSRLPFERFFELFPSRHTRGHGLKLVKHRVRTDLRQHFFSERVVDSWNGLDESTVAAASLSSFKRGLTRMREKKMGL